MGRGKVFGYLGSCRESLMFSERVNLFKDKMLQEDIDRIKKCGENLDLEGCFYFSRERK